MKNNEDSSARALGLEESKNEETAMGKGKTKCNC